MSRTNDWSIDEWAIKDLLARPRLDHIFPRRPPRTVRLVVGVSHFQRGFWLWLGQTFGIAAHNGVINIRDSRQVAENTRIVFFLIDASRNLTLWYWNSRLK